MRNVYLILLIVTAGVMLALSICAPTILAKNSFLMGFINHEILGIMAVIMTISIASIATIHIWFNELEEKHQKRVFGAARREINQSAFTFIGLFVAQLVCLFVRSIPIFENSDTAISVFNGISLLLLLCSVITLWDVMAVVRALTPAD
jgi:uncharacterized protein YacL